MIKNLLSIYRMRYLILKQLLFCIKINLKITKNESVKNLINDGYVHLKNYFPRDVVSEFTNAKKLKNNENCISESLSLSPEEKERIFLILSKLKVFEICKEYLGKNLITYSNVYNYLGKKISNDSSWQPHHDSKMNRLKIYIWMSKKNHETHPLYYSKGSHKKIKTWKNYQETRFPKSKLKFEKIFGDTGDIIIFDTHGIHSNFKTSQIPRECLIITLESYGFLSRINIKTEKGIQELKRIDGEVFNH